MELQGGEAADLQDGLELGSEGGGCFGIGEELGNGLPMDEDLALAGHGLPVIARGLAAGKGGGQQGAGQCAEPMAEARVAQRGQPQPKNLNSTQRKQRRKNLAKNAQLSDIALQGGSGGFQV